MTFILLDEKALFGKVGKKVGFTESYPKTSAA